MLYMQYHVREEGGNARSTVSAILLVREEIRNRRGECEWTQQEKSDYCIVERPPPGLRYIGARRPRTVSYYCVTSK